MMDLISFPWIELTLVNFERVATEYHCMASHHWKIIIALNNRSVFNTQQAKQVDYRLRDKPPYKQIT